jgi:hypothetical protein
MSALCCGTVTRADTIPYRRSDNASPARIKYRMEIRSGIMFKISISRCVYRRIQPRDASFWANFCGVFYSNDHVANYMQLHMVTDRIKAPRRRSTLPTRSSLTRADQPVDLLVMGGYGHSRMREFMLGGVTRGILASMTFPTLMSH